MTQEEIIQALLDRKKIKRLNWNEQMYVHLQEGKIINQNGDKVFAFDLDADYEIYIETVSFFEALEAMKEGKKAKNLKEGYVLFFDEFEILSYLEDNDNFAVEKDDLNTKWQILEDSNN